MPKVSLPFPTGTPLLDVAAGPNKHALDFVSLYLPFVRNPRHFAVGLPSNYGKLDFVAGDLPILDFFPASFGRGCVTG